MLIYLAQGKRTYAAKPVRVYARAGWEFQAVVQGAISQVRPEGPDVLRQNHLWVSPPNHRHGWMGERLCSAEVVVFHFQLVPPVLQALARGGDSLEVALSAGQCRRLRFLADQAARYWSTPTVGMTVCFEHILMELTLLVLESSSRTVEPIDTSRDRVDASIAWFLQRMEECPSLETISSAVGISPAHLRRMFHEVLQTSPKLVLDQLRFQRAMQMMADPSIKLETVGEACGFGSGSAFSRAFKLKFGASPQAWRISYGLE